MKLLLLVFIFLNLFSASAEEPMHVEYYYENYCEACSPEKDFVTEFKALTGIDISECEYLHYNTVKSEGLAALDAAVEKYGIESTELPIAVVNGQVYQGSSAMQNDMALDSLEWGGGTDSTIVYLYTPACESCAEVEELLDSLPESMEIMRGSIKFSSTVNITHVDITQNSALARQLFEERGIPEDERVTPSVFLPEKQLIGSEAIKNLLERYLKLGWAVGGLDLAAGDAVENAVPVNLISALSAGIIAGLNGCALSMLLMFISILLEARQRIIHYVAAFLASKLAAYLLIGFALFEVFQRVNPSWLIPSARILLTVIGAVLVFLNLSDAVHAFRGDLSGMKNQLPVKIRKNLHNAIKALTGKKILLPACAILGILVASGEFLCAGQLYLAYLLQAVQAQADFSVQGLALIIYCLAFLLPSVIVTAVVLICRSTNAVSSVLARHIAPVKLLTSAIMIGLIVLAWVI